MLKSRVGPPGQGCILIRSRDIGWIDALDLFWVRIGTMGALGKLKMKYMHQVRSLSTKRRATIAPMGATGEPEMNYAHQVRSLSTKKGGVRSVSLSRVVTPGEGCILIRSRDIVWIEALDHFWVPIGTTGVLGKPKMKYMHQVRSLSTKKGGGPDPCCNHVL